MNKGYLTCDRGSNSDHVYTPFYAVEPLLKYIPKDWVIWCPFDLEWSAFVQTFRRQGYEVVHSHIDTGEDFFKFTPNRYFDCIVSNPPFSIKDKVIKCLYEIGKPFAILLPLNSLQGQARYKSFKKGIQLLAFDKRIDYHTNENYSTITRGNHFASAYFCKDLLPTDLILEKLHKYERPLKGSTNETKKFI